jgi:hypothetical protein
MTHFHRYWRARFRGQRDHVLRRGRRRVAEPMAKFSCEMSVVAKAAGVGDLAERLACAQQRPALQKTRGVIQTKRMALIQRRIEQGRKVLYAAAAYACAACAYRKLHPPAWEPGIST